ncbi:MAG: hypothetical protein RMI04_09545 [Thermofilaceae archaeon]|nr:hypothetical protein [Thermofilaceae archaeon]
MEILTYGLLAVGGILVLWALFELLSSLLTRKHINDLSYAYLNNLQNSISTILQTGAVERSEFIRTAQIETQLTWQTVRTAIAMDMLTTMVKTLTEEEKRS